MIGDDLQAWWRMREDERVLQLIREIGVWRLANHDGCTCGRFSIRNVDVEVGCGKGGERGVWVSSRSLDYWDETTRDGNDEALLMPIAHEVARQISESDHRGDVPVYCHKRGKKFTDIDGEAADLTDQQALVLSYLGQGTSEIRTPPNMTTWKRLRAGLVLATSRLLSVPIKVREEFVRPDFAGHLTQECSPATSQLQPAALESPPNATHA